MLANPSVYSTYTHTDLRYLIVFCFFLLVKWKWRAYVWHTKSLWNLLLSFVLSRSRYKNKIATQIHVFVCVHIFLFIRINIFISSITFSWWITIRRWLHTKLPYISIGLIFNVNQFLTRLWTICICNICKMCRIAFGYWLWDKILYIYCNFVSFRFWRYMNYFLVRMSHCALFQYSFIIYLHSKMRTNPFSTNNRKENKIRSNLAIKKDGKKTLKYLLRK